MENKKKKQKSKESASSRFFSSDKGLYTIITPIAILTFCIISYVVIAVFSNQRLIAPLSTHSPTPLPPQVGQSTYAACASAADCVTSGCNREICQGAREEARMSICEYKEQTPIRLGLSCGCVQKKCQWTQ